MTLHADLESYLLLCLRLVVKSTFRGPRHLLLVFGGPWEQWLKHFWSCAGTIWISMASNQALRSRLISVQKIQKITKAMKMVAASRLRGAQTKAEGSRGISQPFVFLLGDLADVEGDKHMIVSISSDKGLCGAINSTSAKFSEAMFDIATARGKEAKFVIVGEKGRIELQRRHAKDIAISISEAQKVPISFTQASMMAEDIMKNVEFDVARLVFNRFRSALAYYPTVATDLSPEHLVEESDESKLAQLNRFEEEGEGGELRIEMMRNLSEFGLTAYLFNGMLENAASEMGARMTSMDNSTRNASEMLHKLHLKYNRERQAQITKELIEIISGAAALQDRED